VGNSAEAGAQRHQQTVGAVAVLDVGAGDDDGEQEHESVHGDVSLAALGFLSVMPGPA